MQEEKLWTPEFIGMSGSNLLLFMSQYIMVAALPIFIMETLGGGEVEAGMAMTAFQAGAVTCRPLAGKLIDAVQKQRLLLLASLAFLLIMLAFCFAHALGAIYALRLLHGCIFALATTAAAAMAALVLPPARKGEGIGYFALSTNLAMVAGPLVGLLIIGHLGSRALFLFLTGLAALTLFAAGARRRGDGNVFLVARHQRRPRGPAARRRRRPVRLRVHVRHGLHARHPSDRRLLLALAATSPPKSIRPVMPSEQQKGVLHKRKTPFFVPYGDSTNDITEEPSPGGFPWGILPRGGSFCQTSQGGLSPARTCPPFSGYALTL